ncbi:MAG: M15 family metallopeptidase [Saprospiraceae bacterium]|nr:M15 family metallopeptidase [Saprospiraceae bacterium]
MIWLLLLFVCACQPSTTPVIKPANQDDQKSVKNVSGQDSNEVDISYLMGKFDPAVHPDFMVVPRVYCDAEIRYLRKDVFEAFKTMADDAAKSGIKLVIRSATRNFNNQKNIWERKWKGETVLEDGTKASDINNPVDRALKILKYSSMPGTSRHHWGTDIDINDFENAHFEKGEGKKLYTWMTRNAHRYGFCQVYNAKGQERKWGYEEEKWHWSYLPLATIYLTKAESELRNEMIAGFEGAETAAVIDMVGKYIQGINSSCR